MPAHTRRRSRFKSRSTFPSYAAFRSTREGFHYHPNHPTSISGENAGDEKGREPALERKLDWDLEGN